MRKKETEKISERKRKANKENEPEEDTIDTRKLPRGRTTPEKVLEEKKRSKSVPTRQLSLVNFGVTTNRLRETPKNVCTICKKDFSSLKGLLAHRMMGHANIHKTSDE